MTLYQETQRYHQPLTIGLLLLFTILSLYRLTISILHDTGTLGLSVVSVLLLGLIWYYIFRLQMTIRVSRKKIVIQAPGSLIGQKKLRFRDIEFIEFLSFSPAEMWSGGLVHLSSDYQLLDFGDRKGVHVVMKNGEEYLVFSNRLFDQQNEIGLPQELIRTA